MEGLRALGIHASYVRCYAIGHASIARHLESTQPFASLGQIAQAVDKFSNNRDRLGERAVIFMHLNHLPPDLTTALSDLEGFHRFCRVLAFSSPVYSVKASAYALPSSSQEHSNATFNYSSGFPIPMPDKIIDPRNSLSFSPQELMEFLGKFFNYVGEMMILNTRDFKDKYVTPEKYRDLVTANIRILGQIENPEEESPLLH